MKFKLCIIVVLFLATLTLNGQSIKKCDGKVLSSTSDKLGKLSQKEIADFLLTFGAECRDNAEFSEWSNELLFDILGGQTELTLRTIEKEVKNIQLKIILDDLEEPIVDNEVKGLIAKVEKVKFDDQLKAEIIRRLKIADSKL
jgi:hypothetical protein